MAFVIFIAVMVPWTAWRLRVAQQRAAYAQRQIAMAWRTN